MSVINIEIQSCKQCPFFKTDNQWSSDGWDSMVDWICTKHPENKAPIRNRGDVVSYTGIGKQIEGCVEWHEESKIKVPDWCPAQNIA